MFEKVSQAAERLATHASRRVFLGQLGKGALALAGVLGGVLAFPGRAQAGAKVYCCSYSSGGLGCSQGFCSKVPCPNTYYGTPLSSWFMAANCRRCGVAGSC
jgi:hypothetical protein